MQAGDIYSYAVVYNGIPDISTNIEMVKGSFFGVLSTYDTSSVNMSHCGIRELYCYDLSSINLNDGHIEQLTATGQSTINLNSGQIGKSVNYGSVMLNISGGGISGSLFSYDDTVVNMSGGHIDLIVGHNNSVINLSGGDVGNLYCDGNSSVNIYGYGFLYEAWNDESMLSGFWADGESFFMTLSKGRDNIYEHIVLHNIPEPATLFFLGFGGFLIRRKR